MGWASRTFILVDYVYSLPHKETLFFFFFLFLSLYYSNRFLFLFPYCLFLLSLPPYAGVGIYGGAYMYVCTLNFIRCCMYMLASSVQEIYSRPGSAVQSIESCFLLLGRCSLEWVRTDMAGRVMIYEPESLGTQPSPERIGVVSRTGIISRVLFLRGARRVMGREANCGNKYAAVPREVG